MTNEKINLKFLSPFGFSTTVLAFLYTYNIWNYKTIQIAVFRAWVALEYKKKAQRQAKDWKHVMNFQFAKSYFQIIKFFSKYFFNL